jgi:predicted RNA binding protein YcfA (HicA-like mRNA interferase family)
MANEYRTEVRKIIKEIERQGWIVTQGRHFKARAPYPSTKIVCFSVSPSDYWAIKNIKKDLRAAGAVLNDRGCG